MEYTMMELLPVVQYLSERYTGKESGSVTYDMANQLMEAVLYCIREFEHAGRSEERRVGKECLRLCRSRWSPYH